MKVDSIVVEGRTYVPADSIVQTPTGNRVVLVVDRGWIFAGDLTVEGTRLKLTRAILVQRWDGVGLDGMIADPCSSKVTLKPLKNSVDVPVDSEIFRIPVSENWGIK